VDRARRPRARLNLVRAALRLLVVLALVTALWASFLAPIYDRLVVRASLPVVHALERTRRVAGTRVEGDYTVLTRTPAGAELGEQRLELRTHHNNVPLLVALMLAASPGGVGRRVARLCVAGAILFVTHVAHFVLAVQWEYAVHNTGTYRNDDVGVLAQPFWERLRNGAELRKAVVVAVYEFYAHVGRLVMPVLLWMLLADRRA
jgi:hypothetical protein